MADRSVEVRYFAAAADAAGVTTEIVECPDRPTLGDLSTVLSARHGAPLHRILAVSAYLVDGELTRDRSVPIGGRVDVLPPFAGG